VAAGCGTTRWSDTARTATEQLLISNAIDKAISEFDFTVLAGREVYFEPSYLKGVTDENYIVSSLRQHLLASGCVLRETKDDAEFIVEARSGGVGTDRSDVLFGVPQVTVPTVPGMPLPSTIPELPLAKSTNQKAVAKLAVFVYNRESGRPVLQTGVDPAISTAKNSWIFGAGPFQRGTVYEGTKFAGDGLDIPIIGGREDIGGARMAAVPVHERAIFADGLVSPPKQEIAQETTGESNDEAAPDDAGAAARVVRLPQMPSPPPASPPPPPLPAPTSPSSSAPVPVQRAQYLEPASATSATQRASAVGESTTPDRKRLFDFSGIGNLLRGKKADAPQSP
jgi:hypothetical protein